MEKKISQSDTVIKGPHILILTAFHQRAHISEIYWMGISRLREHFNISTLAVVSDKENKELVYKHSDHVLETSNEPFGLKMNQAISQAAKFEFDMLMQLGSDNLISNMALMKNIDMLSRGILFFGLNRLLIYNSETGQAKEKFYGNVFGAGRCIARPILVKALRKGNLWEDDRQRGMDVTSEQSIEKSTGFIALPVDFDKAQVIDIKSAVNIWPYDQLQAEKEVSPEAMKELVGKEEWKALNGLPKATAQDTEKTKYRK